MRMRMTTIKWWMIDVRKTILRAFSFVDSIERKSKMRKCTEFTIIAIIVTASCVCVLFI